MEYSTYIDKNEYQEDEFRVKTRLPLSSCVGVRLHCKLSCAAISQKKLTSHIRTERQASRMLLSTCGRPSPHIPGLFHLSEQAYLLLSVFLAPVHVIL